jgi:hypothetical protein
MPDNITCATGLAVLATQVRSVTLRVLEVADPAILTWTPPGTSNHILWHAGHSLWVADILTVEPLTGRSELPVGWEKTFGQDSQPATTKTWPDRAEVYRHLEAQLTRVQTLFADHAGAIVARAEEHIPQNGWPLLMGIIHGWHDEARHQGEMHLLTKLHKNQHASRTILPPM